MATLLLPRRVVFVGRIVESEHDIDGEVEVAEAVPCRRCGEEGVV
jgi:hypothetical protein